MLLAVDTATQVSSLDLYDELSVRYEQTWASGRNHSVELAPSVRRAFDHVESGVDALTALAVCIGPGTYTGLRIGVSLAKGMAGAKKLPLIGLTTMEILAAAQPRAEGVLATVAQ